MKKAKKMQSQTSSEMRDEALAASHWHSKLKQTKTEKGENEEELKRNTIHPTQTACHWLNTN